MSWYKAGKVTSVAGTNVITGTGTLWSNPIFGIAPGQMLFVPGAGQVVIYEILAVDSDTKIRTVSNVTSSITNSDYAIVTTVSNSMSDLARRTAVQLALYQGLLEDWQLITTGTGNVTIIAPDGTQVIMPSLNQMNENINSKITQQQLTGVIGTARYVTMNVTLASATAALVAAEIIVQTAGGLQYKIPNFNKSINLATVGAGGMNAGTAPANGFVALYAIYNPSSTASALLAVNTTGSVAPEVCGVTMPAGYTASALISVWRTASSLLVEGQQIDRTVIIAASAVSSGSGNVTSQSFSLDAAAPKNTKSALIEAIINATGSGNSLIRVAASDRQIGRVFSQIGGPLASFSAWVLVTKASNALFLTTGSGVTTPSYSVYCNGYSF
ncbi:hypothetical protein [Yersinia vastinensis]|uniref:hypothetical protein n=1 Tax=Yersinia vastinensis TaxID=2890318 RepID=UPI001F3897E6|nr:hypothetical protein [Yersinia vastinensis]